MRRHLTDHAGSLTNPSKLAGVLDFLDMAVVQRPITHNDHLSGRPQAAVDVQDSAHLRVILRELLRQLPTIPVDGPAGKTRLMNLVLDIVSKLKPNETDDNLLQSEINSALETNHRIEEASNRRSHPPQALRPPASLRTDSERFRSGKEDKRETSDGEGKDGLVPSRPPAPMSGAQLRPHHLSLKRPKSQLAEPSESPIIPGSAPGGRAVTSPEPEPEPDQNKAELLAYVTESTSSANPAPETITYMHLLRAWLEKELATIDGPLLDAAKEKYEEAVQKCITCASDPKEDDLFLDDLDLRTLPPVPKHVRWLTADNNQLTELPSLEGTAIQFLSLSDNSLKSLPKLPTSLEELDVENNALTNISALANPELAVLYKINLKNNRISEISERVVDTLIDRAKRAPFYQVDIQENPLDEQTDLYMERESNKKSVWFQKPAALGSTTTALEEERAREAQVQEERAAAFRAEREARNRKLLANMESGRAKFQQAAVLVAKADTEDKKIAALNLLIKRAGANDYGECMPISRSIAEILTTGEPSCLVNFLEFHMPHYGNDGISISTERLGIRGETYEKAASLEELRDKLLAEGDGAVALVFPPGHAIAAVNLRGQVFVIENYAYSSPEAMPIEKYHHKDGGYFFGVMKQRLHASFNAAL